MRGRVAIRLLVGAGALAVAGFVAVYFLFFTTDSPPPLRLTQSPVTTTGGQTAGTAAQAPPNAAGGALTGMWKVAGGSEAGYRVREKLARLPAPSDAVGRTPAVTGQVHIDHGASGVSASAARFEVDLTQLASDSDNRDDIIRTRGLESARFPTAAFVATEPIRLSSLPAPGQPTKVTAVGDLTIHGVTKRVSIPIDGQLMGSQIELVGSLKFPLSDFAIDPPSVAGVVTVESDATLEFRLVLERG